MEPQAFPGSVGRRTPDFRLVILTGKVAPTEVNDPGKIAMDTEKLAHKGAARRGIRRNRAPPRRSGGCRPRVERTHWLEPCRRCHAGVVASSFAKPRSRPTAW